MNQNTPTDDDGNLLVTLAGITTVEDEGIKALAIINAGGSVGAQQEGEWVVDIGNPQEDPPTAANQTTANDRLADIKTAVELIRDRLPSALVDGTLVTTEANSELIRAQASQINAKLPDLLGTSPLETSQGVTTRPVEQDWITAKTTRGTVAKNLVVRAGPCWLASIFVSNPDATPYFVTIYNLTSAPTDTSPATGRVWPGKMVGALVGLIPGELAITFDKPMKLSTGCVVVLESGSDPTNTTIGAGSGATMAATYSPAT